MLLEDSELVLKYLQRIEKALEEKPSLRPDRESLDMVFAILKGMIEAEEVNPEIYVINLVYKGFKLEFEALQATHSTIRLQADGVAALEMMGRIVTLLGQRRDQLKATLLKEFADKSLPDKRCGLFEAYVGAEAKPFPPKAMGSDAKDLQPPWTLEKLNQLMQCLAIPAPAGAIKENASISVVPARSNPPLRYGFLFQLHWTTVDALNGGPIVVHSAKHFIDERAAKNEILQAILAAVIRASEHEIRENFEYRGQAIYRPHQNADVLWRMTAATQPQLREPSSPDLNQMGVETLP